VHAIADVHDTSEKLDSGALGIFGVVSMLQLVPSQDSTRVSFPLEPTALQSVPAGAHEILAK
jgi:hypothetical protein